MRTIQNVSIIGAGIMGAGIAAAVFKYGYNVKIFDVNTNLARTACENIKQKARRSQDPDKISQADTLQAVLSDADLIIEAIFENLEAKKSLFKELGELANEATLFASNTSSLSISELAAASGRPDRFLGLHFFNPPVATRLVEVIIPGEFKNQYLDVVNDFIKGIKKTGVKCKESPGFIVNRILLPLINEAFYLLDEKVRNESTDLVFAANDIDSALLKKNILLMGPFNLADLTGLDTILKVAEVIWHGFNDSPRYIPAPLLRELIAKGSHGRKTKHGIYFYKNSMNDPDLNPCLDKNHNSVIPAESPQFDSLRLVSIMVNESCRVLEEDIVDSFKDIEVCMELGTRWPRGPFKLAKEIGPEKIKNYLESNYSRTDNNPRYEVSRLFGELTEELKEYFNSGES